MDYDLYNEMNICPILRSSCANTGCQFGFQRRKNMLGSKCLDSKEKNKWFPVSGKKRPNLRLHLRSRTMPLEVAKGAGGAAGAAGTFCTFVASKTQPRGRGGGGGGAMSCNVTCNIICNMM